MPDLTTSEAAAYLAERGYTVKSHRQAGVSGPPKADTIKKWCERGKIEGARKASARLWLIPQEGLDQFIAKQWDSKNDLD